MVKTIARSGFSERNPVIAKAIRAILINIMGNDISPYQNVLNTIPNYLVAC
jgi:hypothetical protein